LEKPNPGLNVWNGNLLKWFPGNLKTLGIFPEPFKKVLETFEGIKCRKISEWKEKLNGSLSQTPED